MAKKSSRRLTEQERADRRRQDRERLQLAAQQLLSSEGWKRWVRVRSHDGLARLSISNQLLVAPARATRRHIRRGLQHLAPAGLRGAEG